MHFKRLLGIVIVVSMTLSQLDCGDTVYSPNPVVPAPNVLDPAVRPATVNTYPPNNAVGPFDVYTPATPNLPHFAVQFTKQMSMSTFTTSSVHCSSGGALMRIRLHISATSLRYSDVAEFDFTDSLGRSFYHVGAKYSVTIDTTVQDINGVHPAHPVTFSFTPEPFLRVVAVLPAQGDSAGVFSQLELFLNSPFPTAQLAHVHIEPSLVGVWSGTVDSSYQNASPLVFTPTSGFPPSKTFKVVVDAGTKDVFGNTLSHAFSTMLHSKPLPPFHIIVESPSPYNFPQLSDSIVLSFSQPIDTSTILRGLSITPQPANSGFVAFLNGFSYAPAEDFLPNTQYTVIVSTSLKSIYSDSLVKPDTFSFSTPAFSVSLGYSNTGLTGVARNTSVFVSTTSRLLESSIAGSFSIYPPVSGSFAYYFPLTGFWFTPNSLLAPFTTYTVAVSTSLQSIGGYTLSQPDTVQFITGSQ